MTIPRNATNDDLELTDADAAHALVLGSAIGIPAILVIVLLVGLAAGASWTDSFVFAAWPALVGGPFFGALVVLGGAARTQKHHAAVIPIAPASPTHAAASTRAA